MERECEVLVVGGGAAGIAAAVGAARSGASVILLERYGFLGGLATAGMVGTICGLYHRAEDSQACYVCSGFVREWAERLAQSSSSEPVSMSDGLWVLPYDNWSFRRLADEISQTTPGLELILHGTLTSVKVCEKHVVEVNALVWDRNITLRPKCIVDCTGEATVVYLARGGVEESKTQAAGVLFTMAPVEVSLQTIGERVSILRQIVNGVAQGRLDKACRNVSLVPLVDFNKGVCFKLALANNFNDSFRKMTLLELEARKLIDELSCFLISSCPAFKMARLSDVAIQVGIRIGRRVKGQTVLSETDVLECRKFSDGVACGVWPIEERFSDGQFRLTHLPVGGYYEIPLGCLMARDLDNVFTAGRCISGSERALCSARVIGTTLATGWAAGVAAAVQAAGKPVSVAVQRLREEQVPGRV